MRIDFSDSIQSIVTKLIDNIVLPPCRLFCFLLCILLGIWLPIAIIVSSALVLAFAGLEVGESIMNWVQNRTSDPDRVWMVIIAVVTGLSGMVFKETKITQYIIKIITYNVQELFKKIWNSIKIEELQELREDKKCNVARNARIARKCRLKSKSEISVTGKLSVTGHSDDE